MKVRIFWSLVLALSFAALPSSAAPAESVTLHSAFLGYQSTHGCTQHSGAFDIVTTPFGHDKSVYVHLRESDGVWIDVPAAFVASLPEGRELWRATAVYGQGACPTPKPPPDTFEFAIKVSTPSGDAWDNNGGANHRAPKGSGSYLAATNATVGGAFVFTSPEGIRSFQATAFVRNIAYEKNADIVYTTDEWRTVLTTPLTYTPSYTLGYGTYASPNANGVEVWLRSPVTIDRACVDFALRYRVGGAEYWDNNFGRNYRVCEVE